MSNLRNPPWTRDEIILALDLYHRHRELLPSKKSKEVIELSNLLRDQAEQNGIVINESFRNRNGVYMKLMNFRSLDPNYTVDGKIGLERGGKLEEEVWSEFENRDELLITSARDLREKWASNNENSHTYWILVCNPKKWAIDRFLKHGETNRDTWGVRPSDKDKFAPGQLAIIRVGQDKRTKQELSGSPKLVSGIYALCEIESHAFEGTGANDDYWAAGETREPGWSTVNIRYLKNYLDRPLTIERLKKDKPHLSRSLLEGFQGSTIPIPKKDFLEVMELLGEDLNELPTFDSFSVNTEQELIELSQRYENACPEVRETISKRIERGSIGARVKELNGYRCQFCQALGMDPLGFKKKNGVPYVEAHHVVHVSEGERGSLAPENIITLCANHHRQVHYGDVLIKVEKDLFNFMVDGEELKIKRILTF